MNIVQKLGDKTTHDTRPDYDSAKGYYWMKQAHAAKQAAANGEPVYLPRKPRKGLAEHSFFSQVDRRLSRQSFTVGASFDKDGKLIRSDT